METKKIEVSYYILNGIGATFDTIFIKAKPDMTISDIFDLVRQKYKKDKNIVELKLIDWKQIKSEL